MQKSKVCSIKFLWPRTLPWPLSVMPGVFYKDVMQNVGSFQKKFPCVQMLESASR